MGSIPSLRPRDVIKAFERLGWERERQRGSHIIMTKPGHLATLSIPDHPYVARGTLRGLLAKSGVSLEDFIDSLP
ncbi:MAG: type II toxin-antitoxin system HicA family toxin [Deltaproteobacteria bacterium]|nr:type II toxin-antitoxin system HicA family toxin [Deltaproteobacteria bacterium]